MMFNMIIESLNLREIELTGRQFTWANSLPVPTYEKLDRVLASVEWEQKYPLVGSCDAESDLGPYTTPFKFGRGYPCGK